MHTHVSALSSLSRAGSARSQLFAAALAGMVMGAPLSAQHPDGSAAPGALTALSPDQLRADLKAFRSDFMGRDKSFAPAARAEAERRLQALEAEIDRVSRVRFELALAQVAALADNGHTGSAAAIRSLHFDRVGLRLTPLADEWRVLRTREASADLLGARLVAVDGHAIAELRDSARALAGGVAAWRDRNASFLMESPEQLHALGLAALPDRATYTFESQGGKTMERVLIAEPSSSGRPTGGPARWLFPEPTPTEGAGWRTLLPVASAPWALQEPGKPFRFRSAPEINGFVVQLRQTMDAPDRSVRDFLNEMLETIKRDHPMNVVVDMRLNGGGDLNKARDFMKALPGLVPGRVFVLTSAWTFSAAISSVGYLKQAAPSKVSIVGEEVGDRQVFFAEGSGVTLPNTQARFGVATERHDYKDGCRAFSDCHGPVVRNPIAVPTFTPDIPVAWTFQAYAAGTDPAMDAVAAALARM